MMIISDEDYVDALVLSQQNAASASLLDLAIVEVSLYLLMMMVMMMMMMMMTMELAIMMTARTIRIYLALAGLQRRLARGFTCLSCPQAGNPFLRGEVAFKRACHIVSIDINIKTQ